MVTVLHIQQHPCCLKIPDFQLKLQNNLRVLTRLIRQETEKCHYNFEEPTKSQFPEAATDFSHIYDLCLAFQYIINESKC